MQGDSMGQAFVLVHKWFPGRSIDEDAIIQAAWLEQDYWQRMEAATANGIARAFNGK